MTDPLTYLDEVDARTAAATARLNAHATYLREGPRTDPPYTFSSVPYQEDLQTVLTGSPALSKALRAVFAIHPREVIAVHEGYGEEAWCPRCQEHYPCETVRAIQAALAVNDEGGTR